MNAEKLANWMFNRAGEKCAQKAPIESRIEDDILGVTVDANVAAEANRMCVHDEFVNSIEQMHRALLDIPLTSKNIRNEY